jgi:hypothetical protein
MAVSSCAGGDRFSDLGGRCCVAICLRSGVVGLLFCRDGDGEGGGLVIALLVGHDD